MITCKLLAYADGKALSTTAASDEVEFPKGGDEIARTHNLVAQLDDCAGVTPTTATVTPKLQGYDGENWVDIVTFPAVLVANAIAGARLINYAKLPLGLAKYAKTRLYMTCSATISDAKYSAWLTPSAEQTA